jgi:hypothetical protein
VAAHRRARRLCCRLRQNRLPVATLTALHKMVRRDDLRESQTQFIQGLV